MKEFESLKRIGAEKPRSYYIPFGQDDTPAYIFGITDRKSSSEFISLDGVWQFGEYLSPEDFDINAVLEKQMPVPACVQMHGCDRIQYLNSR